MYEDYARSGFGIAFKQMRTEYYDYIYNRQTSTEGLMASLLLMVNYVLGVATWGLLRGAYGGGYSIGFDQNVAR